MIEATLFKKLQSTLWDFYDVPEFLFQMQLMYHTGRLENPPLQIKDNRIYKSPNILNKRIGFDNFGRMLAIDNFHFNYDGIYSYKLIDIINVTTNESIVNSYQTKFDNDNSIISFRRWKNSKQYSTFHYTTINDKKRIIHNSSETLDAADYITYHYNEYGLLVATYDHCYRELRRYEY